MKRLYAAGSVTVASSSQRHRGRDRRTRDRPQGVRRGDRAVPAVLVEVDEDPLAALLLPPGRGHAVVALLQLAAEADRGVPHVDELPARLDPHEDMDAAVAAGLGPSPQPQLLEQLARDPGHPHGVGERRTGLGVEVDPQLVGAVDVVTAYGPGVEGERAHVGAPDRDRDLGRADLVGLPAAGEGDLDGLEVVGGALGHALLVERVGVAVLGPGRELHALADTGGPALQRGRPVAQGPHQAVARRSRSTPPPSAW